EEARQANRHHQAGQDIGCDDEACEGVDQADQEGPKEDSRCSQDLGRPQDNHDKEGREESVENGKPACRLSEEGEGQGDQDGGEASGKEDRDQDRQASQDERQEERALSVAPALNRRRADEAMGS
ncbi:MAG: hypothetical protein E6501_27675, partial [Bradyrhizobium sp.]|nr:hypothetical protein [Bradyrhizobium sp.]